MPLLVRIVWMQVVSNDLGDTQAMTYLQSLGKQENVPDWGRAILTAYSRPAVDVGHELCASTLGLEFQELKSVMMAEGQSLDNATPLRDVFKDPVGPSVVDGSVNIRIVGLDLFADIEERHMLAIISSMHLWLKEAWGVRLQRFRAETSWSMCTFRGWLQRGCWRWLSPRAASFGIGF